MQGLIQEGQDPGRGTSVTGGPSQMARSGLLCLHAVTSQLSGHASRMMTPALSACCTICGLRECATFAVLARRTSGTFIEYLLVTEAGTTHVTMPLLVNLASQSALQTCLSFLPSVRGLSRRLKLVAVYFPLGLVSSACAHMSLHPSSSEQVPHVVPSCTRNPTNAMARYVSRALLAASTTAAVQADLHGAAHQAGNQGSSSGTSLAADRQP